jgi:glycosyltransferase involved in cell wall biosynthesis
MAKAKKVEFIHEADDASLIDAYREAGVFVQASTHSDMYGNRIQKPELMGLTTIEAMSTGAPVITSNAGSLPELASDQRFASVFRTEDELHTQLKAVLERRWPLAGASALAREHVVANFSQLEVGSRALDLYDAALAHGRAAGVSRKIRS